MEIKKQDSDEFVFLNSVKNTVPKKEFMIYIIAVHIYYVCTKYMYEIAYEEFEAYDRSMKNLIKGGSFEDYRKASENLKIQVPKELENYHKTLDFLNTARKNLIKITSNKRNCVVK